ncbi:hypothetical protein ND00_07020 [Clostridium sp. L74]|nr:hypothetical protein ND00_07020 [Clostridium sp. L74]
MTIILFNKSTNDSKKMILSYNSDKLYLGGFYDNRYSYT